MSTSRDDEATGRASVSARTSEHEWLTYAEVLGYLKVSRWTLTRWMKRKRNPIPFYTPGGIPRFKRPEVDRWVMRQRGSQSA